jgi:hypothetical protein
VDFFIGIPGQSAGLSSAQRYPIALFAFTASSPAIGLPGVWPRTSGTSSWTSSGPLCRRPRRGRDSRPYIGIFSFPFSFRTFDFALPAGRFGGLLLRGLARNSRNSNMSGTNGARANCNTSRRIVGSDFTVRTSQTDSIAPALIVAAALFGAVAIGYMFLPFPKFFGQSAMPDATTAPGNVSSQSQPQGATGPIDTGSSGGAPASSPQGETPPGMQSAPQGSSTK